LISTTGDDYEGRDMYSEGPIILTVSAGVLAVPAGATAASLFAPSQLLFGIVILANLLAMLGVLLLIRSRRLDRGY
jgi:hypothetical protein